MVIMNDETTAVALEAKRCGVLDRVHFALDFFDGSINRISAWVIGTRSFQKAILYALLEPSNLLLEAEHEGNYGRRLALMEEFRTLPFGAVWNMYCEKKGVPVGPDWLKQVEEYEKNVLSKR